MEILDIYKKFSEYYFYKGFKVMSNTVHTAGCYWYNTVFFNEIIRYNHLEYFKSDNEMIEVFHNVMLPNLSLRHGIFGFDIIKLNGKVTGIFCDVTNGINGSLVRVRENYKDYKRERPEWASFFSDNFLIIKGPEDLKSFIDQVKDIKEEYLNVNISNIYNAFKEQGNVKIQNEYCINQRKNAKTFNALSRFVGEDKAKDFIENILFPIIS